MKYCLILLFSYTSFVKVCNSNVHLRTNKVNDNEYLKEVMAKPAFMKNHIYEESYYGTWVIKSFFVRSGISGITTEDATKLIGKSISFTNQKFTIPTSTEICSISSIKKTNIAIDLEIKNNFNLQQTTFDELEIKCGAYERYFYILSSNKAIFERDGGVYLLQKQ